MKTFNGDNWNNSDQDTGWRDISSDAHLVGTTDYDPVEDTFDPNLPLQQATTKVYIRRVLDRVTMVVDFDFPDGVNTPSLETASIFPDVPDSPLIKIGLPFVYAVSDQVIRYTRGDSSLYSNIDKTAEAVLVLGRVYKQADGVGLAVWDKDFFDEYTTSFSSRRYTLNWYTQDDFPREPVGVGI